MINVTNGDREYTFFLSNTNPDLPLEDRHIDIELGGHLEGGFCGTVRAAREAGFTVEEIEVGEPPATDADTITDLLNGEQDAQRRLNTVQDEIVALKERIEGLEKDLAGTKETLVGTQELLVTARGELIRFKDGVVDMFREKE